MRVRYLVGVLALSLATPSGAAAQASTSAPVIQRTVLVPDSGVLTIAGTGLGPDVTVFLEGEMVPVLPGATTSKVQVQAPAALLAGAGSSRLVVVNAARTGADAFVVTGGASLVVPGGGTAVESHAPTVSAGDMREQAAAPSHGAHPRASQNGPSPSLVETGVNTAVGVDALANNTTGVNNTALGSGTLFFNSTGSRNTATGQFALVQNRTGAGNTASGVEALSSNTTGAYNTASGFQAMNSNVGAWYNTATGVFALRSNTLGWQNTATGTSALYQNTAGNNNTASGFEAMVLNTTGSDNTAHGTDSLYSNTLGSFNAASGAYSLYGNTSGNYNTAAGVSALLSNTIGSRNVGLGANAGADAVGSSNIHLGADVRGVATDANTMRLGLPYTGATGTGQNRTFIAGIAGTVLTTPAVQVFIDANGQLGTLVPAPFTGTISGPLGADSRAEALQQALEEQRVLIADLRERLGAQDTAYAELRARLARLEARSNGRTPER